MPEWKRWTLCGKRTAIMKSVLVTGSSGLIGSECVEYFDRLGWKVHGIDNNMRMQLFGPDGDTTWNLKRLRASCQNFEHHELDIRDRDRILALIRTLRPHLLIHCASQPSHDLAKDRPFDDFDINATATLSLLEGMRRHCPESPFIFMSTNKVYGDAPNEIPLRELPTRWDYARIEDFNGVNESCRIDASLHSLFGASKAAADLMVQEYGRYFNMPTVCFRGGCLTGSNHAGAELHGFLAYLARCFHENRTYRIYGYKGKQVRDNLHSQDVCAAMVAFYESPRAAAVYNLGGGRANSISINEAINRMQELLGKRLNTLYIETQRVGDHVCYISDLRRFQQDYPEWKIEVSLEDILTQFAKLDSRVN
jgi:CDP-paratose 2-epimerase